MTLFTLKQRLGEKGLELPEFSLGLWNKIHFLWDVLREAAPELSLEELVQTFQEAMALGDMGDNPLFDQQITQELSSGRDTPLPVVTSRLH